MNSFFGILLSILISGAALASVPGISAVRNIGESYESARSRQLYKIRFKIPGTRWNDVQSITYSTPERVKKPLQNVNFNDLPDVGSYSTLENYFKFIRDTRFITTEDPSFPRRPSWLYPDDGCYVRAEVAKNELVQSNLPAPKKLFVFGNLFAKSNNSPSGSVQWWYHVAVAYRVGDIAYVLDPSLEPTRPLKVQEWNVLVGGLSNRVQYAICSAQTYDPTVDCNGSDVTMPEEALQEQKSFLPTEWDRLIELNRLPEKELGDLPPWL